MGSFERLEGGGEATSLGAARFELVASGVGTGGAMTTQTIKRKRAADKYNLSVEKVEGSGKVGNPTKLVDW